MVGMRANLIMTTPFAFLAVSSPFKLCSLCVLVLLSCYLSMVAVALHARTRARLLPVRVHKCLG